MAKHLQKSYLHGFPCYKFFNNLYFKMYCTITLMLWYPAQDIHVCVWNTSPIKHLKSYVFFYYLVDSSLMFLGWNDNLLQKKRPSWNPKFLLHQRFFRGAKIRHLLKFSWCLIENHTIQTIGHIFLAHSFQLFLLKRLFFTNQPRSYQRF